jgi:hypothetical protein
MIKGITCKMVSSDIRAKCGLETTQHYIPSSSKLFIHLLWGDILAFRPQLRGYSDIFIGRASKLQWSPLHNNVRSASGPNVEHCKLTGLLSPLPISNSSWQDIPMDFIEGLSVSNGYSVILVVVDIFTKYANFYPLKHPFTANSIAVVFLDNVMKLHGIPKTIESDRDKVFKSAFWKALFSALKVKLQMSSAYHPQTDGQTERVNQCL